MAGKRLVFVRDISVLITGTIVERCKGFRSLLLTIFHLQCSMQESYSEETDYNVANIKSRKNLKFKAKFDGIHFVPVASPRRHGSLTLLHYADGICMPPHRVMGLNLITGFRKVAMKVESKTNILSMLLHESVLLLENSKSSSISVCIRTNCCRNVNQI